MEYATHSIETTLAEEVYGENARMTQCALSAEKMTATVKEKSRVNL